MSDDMTKFNQRHRRIVEASLDDGTVWIECTCGTRRNLGHRPTVNVVLRANLDLHDNDPGYAREQRDAATCIRTEDLSPNVAYELASRNIVVGIYDGHDGFVGIREKFGHRFLDTEYHWDRGAPHGTARPLRKLVPVPKELDLDDHGALFKWLDALEKREFARSE